MTVVVIWFWFFNFIFFIKKFFNILKPHTNNKIATRRSVYIIATLAEEVLFGKPTVLSFCNKLRDDYKSEKEKANLF